MWFKHSLLVLMFTLPSAQIAQADSLPASLEGPLESLVSVAECGPKQVKMLYDSYASLGQSAPSKSKADTLTRLLACQPHRGDLLIELIQVQIELGDVGEAYRLRQQMAERNGPPGILALVDGWIAASGFKSPEGVALVRSVDYDLPRSLKIGLGFGYDTNPNSGSDAREILLSIGGVDQVLRLSANSLPQPSLFQALKVDAVSPSATNRAWLMGLQLTQFNKGADGNSQLDNLVYAGQVFSGGGCDFAIKCRQLLLVGAGNTRNENYEFINHRYSVDWATLQFALSSSMLRRAGELDSVRLGGDWYMTPTFFGLHTKQDLLLDAGISYDSAQNDRAGDDQLRVHIGGNWLPRENLSLNLRSEWLSDTQDYSPSLFGSAQRRVTIHTLKMDYAFKKTTSGLYNLLLEKRISNSNIELFSNESLKVELNYQHSVAL